MNDFFYSHAKYFPFISMDGKKSWLIYPRFFFLFSRIFGLIMKQIDVWESRRKLMLLFILLLRFECARLFSTPFFFLVRGKGERPLQFVQYVCNQNAVLLFSHWFPSTINIIYKFIATGFIYSHRKWKSKQMRAP